MTMIQRNHYFIIIASCFALIILLAGCSIPGKIYISLSWEFDYDVENIVIDDVNTNIPNVPTDIAEIGEGAYYYTYAGSYSFVYSYSDETPQWSRNLDVVLEPNETILGKENAYYDVIIAKAKPPAIYEVPANP
jgi:hypothetical protein